MLGLGFDGTPSTGSNALKGTRDVAHGGMKGGKDSAMLGLGFDGTPSTGSNALKGNREVAHGGMKGGKGSAMIGTSTDNTPSAGSVARQNARAFKGTTSMQGGSGFGPDFKFLTHDEKLLAEREHDGEEGGWHQTTKVVFGDGDIKKSIFKTNGGDVAQMHDFRGGKASSAKSKGKSWMPVNTKMGGSNASSASKMKSTFVVEPVLTVEEVRSFKFRQLDKINAKVDWKAAGGQKSSGAEGLFARAPLLAHEPYVDPSKRVGSVRNTPSTTKVRIHSRGGSRAPSPSSPPIPTFDNAKSPPAERKLYYSAATTPRTLGPKNVPGRIQQALAKHKVERAAEYGSPSAAKSKVKRANNTKLDTSVTPLEFNKLVAALEQSRDYFYKVTELADAFVVQTDSLRKAVTEQRSMTALCEKSKRAAAKANKLLTRPKTFARKTTGTVALFEYRELMSVLKTVELATRRANEIREHILQAQCKQQYAPYGIRPSVLIAFIPPKTTLGVDIKLYDAAFGCRVCAVDPESPGKDLRVGCALLEIGGEFLVDLKAKDVKTVIAKQSYEAIVTYLTVNDVNPLSGGGEAAVEIEAEFDEEDDESMMVPRKMPVRLGPEPDPLPRPGFAVPSLPTRLPLGTEKSSPSGYRQYKYDWEASAANGHHKALELRREQLLRNSSLADNPDLMEEWLALLLARNTAERNEVAGAGGSDTAARRAEDPPAAHDKSPPKKKVGWFNKLSQRFRV
eukprot:gene18535-17499_t